MNSFFLSINMQNYHVESCNILIVNRFIKYQYEVAEY
jgi:hypothetical protein